MKLAGEKGGFFLPFWISCYCPKEKHFGETKDVAGKGESWKQGTYSSSEDGETTEKSGEGDPQLSLSGYRKKSFS